MRIFGEFIAGLEGFEWDAGNSDKNWLRHNVHQTEAEQVLLNRPLVLAVDLKHSQQEPQFLVFRKRDAARQLAIVFTERGNLVRVISAGTMNLAERHVYAQAQARPETNS